jgi:predicted SAM-dependent methyltransferase
MRNLKQSTAGDRQDASSGRTVKQRIGNWLIPRLPINRHVFKHFRLELNALKVRALNKMVPSRRKLLRQLSQRRELLVNLGCGPFGHEGWVNLDLYACHPNVTLTTDCRWTLPLADGSCAGIHVEHFIEHLCPFDERPSFLSECRRCLRQGGVLRLVVPDGEKYIRAYVAEGWNALNDIGCGGDVPDQTFATKMQALNHVFLQDEEHYGGYDRETLALELRQAGFTDVEFCQWRCGRFPFGPIDRELHRPYSLYAEAIRTS